MEEIFNKFEEKLEALEDGASIESCTQDLAADLAENLRVAASLRSFQPPPRDPERINSQLAALAEAARKQQAGRVKNLPLAKIKQYTNSHWYSPLAAAGGVLFVLTVCMAYWVVGMGVSRGIAWFFDRLSQEHASVLETHGLVEVQGKDGRWESVSEGEQFKVGVNFRTRNLSSAVIQLDDGSQIRPGSAERDIVRSNESFSNRCPESAHFAMERHDRTHGHAFQEFWLCV
jgi:hypothetical protein